MRRVRGDPPPWTEDPVLLHHRFTNTFRAADRVSQYLINYVIPGSRPSPSDVLFRVLLFKIFNRISTWALLERQLGVLHAETFDVSRVDGVMSSAAADGVRLYSAAYVMPPPMLGRAKKHSNHLRLLKYMLEEGVGERIAAATSMQQAYRILLGYPSVGPFLAFQWLIDLNYSDLCNFSEMDFVVAGPGAISGIRKCFENAGELPADDLIRHVADQSLSMSSRFGITLPTLWGRPLQLVDFQSLFCEVDKYARAVHPDVAGIGGRNRIKQRYRTVNPQRPIEGFPPKWGLPIDAVVLDGSEITFPIITPAANNR